MYERIKSILNGSEKGQILVLAIIFMLFGSVIVTSLLGLMSTSLKTTVVYDDKSETLYAADAGIEDAMWQIKYDQLDGTFDDYNRYDFGSAGWTYDLPQEVNDQGVEVNIKNVWIPPISPTPTAVKAKAIVDTGKLMVTGGAYGVSSFNIVLTYDAGASENLLIDSIGVWLPPGFTYVEGSSTLEETGKPYTKTPTTATYKSGQKIIWNYTTALAFTSLQGVKTTDSPMTTSITFDYAAEKAGARPEAVAWTTTKNVDLDGDGDASGIHFSWDKDIRVFGITSTSQSTTVETYVAKSEMRKMGGAVNGDYYATGNSLMRDSLTNPDGVKETKINTSAVVTDPSPAGADNGIPGDANVTASYLYWGTWYKINNGRCSNLFFDGCSRFSQTSPPPTVYYWDEGSAWTVSSSRFRATGYNYTETSPDRDIVKHSSFAFDLGSFPSPEWVFTLSWEQWYGGTTPGESDGLDFAISKDGGSTWSNWTPAFRGSGVGNSGYKSTATYQYNIPVTFLTSSFKIKFHVVGFSTSGQYCYIDNIRINALDPDRGLTFKINNGSGDKIVYFDSDGNPAYSTNPADQIVSTRTQVLLTYSYSDSSAPSFNGFAQACYRDITPLVQAYAEQPVAPAVNKNGHATYTAVGDLGDPGEQLSHAGWSLVTIFSGPQTMGHQLYLYETFFGSRQDSGGVHVDWDGDGSPQGRIEGFVVPQKIAGEVNAAKVTCFVTEGDNQLNPDYFSINGTKLWDGKVSTSNSQASPNNVWNANSYLSGGYTMSNGVDIDTLGIDPTADPPQYITWDSDILKSGDTFADIDLYTSQDYWFMIYMIISFRSETTTGGSLAYLIRG
jgi:hypothetical protein